jgi:hypothetical protein
MVASRNTAGVEDRGRARSSALHRAPSRVSTYSLGDDADGNTEYALASGTAVGEPEPAGALNDPTLFEPPAPSLNTEHASDTVGVDGAGSQSIGEEPTAVEAEETFARLEDAFTSPPPPTETHAVDALDDSDQEVGADDDGSGDSSLAPADYGATRTNEIVDESEPEVGDLDDEPVNSEDADEQSSSDEFEPSAGTALVSEGEGEGEGEGDLELEDERGGRSLERASASISAPRRTVAFSPEDKNADLPPLPPGGELGGAAYGMRPRSMGVDQNVASGWMEQIGLPENVIRVQMWGPKSEKSSFEVKLDEEFTIAAVRDGIQKVAPMLPRSHIDNLDFFEISGQGVSRQLANTDDPREARQNKGEIVVMPPEERPVTLYFQTPDGALRRDFVILPLKWKTMAKTICNPKHKGHSKGFRKNLREVAPGDSGPEAAPALFLRKNFRDTMFADDDRPLDVFYDVSVDGAPRERIPHSTATKLVIKSKALRTDIARRDSVITEYDATAPLQGYLHKKGDDARAAWKRRWFIFREGVLYYYRDQKDRDAIASINASAFVRCHGTDRPERPFHIILKTNLDRGHFHLAAESTEAAERWIVGLQDAVVQPSHAGTLQKKGEQGGGWKSRYFELRGRHLVYYESKAILNRQKGTIILDEHAYVEPSIDEETRFSVVTTSSKRKTGVYELRAASSADAQEWVDAVRRATKGQAPLVKEDTFGDLAPVVDELYPAEDSLGDDFTAADSRQLDSRGDRGRASLGRFVMPREKPRPLGVPLFDPSEAAPETKFRDFDEKPNSYADVTDDEWTRRDEDIRIDPKLEDVMGRPDALNALGFARPAAVVDIRPVYEDRVDELKQKASSQGGEQRSPSKRPVPTGLLDVFGNKSGMGEDDEDGEQERERAPEPVFNPGFLEILSPAMLRTFVLGEADAEFTEEGHSRVSLSGVCLSKQANNAWTLARGATPHGPFPAAVRESHSVETFHLRGGIVVHFVAEEERWHVVATAPTSQPNGRPQENASLAIDPVIKEWLRLGGARPITLAEAAVEQIVHMYNEPLSVVQNGMRKVKQPQTVTAEMQAAVAKTRQLVLDDSRNERIGIVVRKDVCGALADALRSGMRQSRMFSKTTLWTLITSASPKPTALSAAYQHTAHKVVKDLERNPNMVGDHDIKFRSFICAGLNHHFLCSWLEGLYHNEAVIKRHYVDFAFMHVCPEPIFQRLITALEPLMALPFRLFTSFELRRRSVHGRPTASAPPPPGRNRMMSTQSAAPARQSAAPDRPRNSDQIRSASIYVEEPTTRPRSASFFVEGSGPAAATEADVDAALPSADSGPSAQALYDNLSPDDGELGFRQGDILEIIKQLDGNWLLCGIGGQQGEVPMNYVNILT